MARPEDPDTEEFARLVGGDKAAWAAFVDRYGGVIFAVVRRTLEGAGAPDAVDDAVQDVFVRLCDRDFRLLRRYDRERASLSTWLAVIARSVAIDVRRRRRPAAVALDDLDADPATDGEPPERLRIPPDLLSPRQRLVLAMTYERDMDAADIARVLGVEAQTVRSARHKALTKLRTHFGEP